jgi:crossover junction endodeoxyribonuclease RuvC
MSGKVLGIDPGSAVTGWGVVESHGGGRLTLVAEGELNLKSFANLPEKLLAIKQGLCSVIEEFAPESVAVESLFFAKNAKSAIVLAHARGAALCSIAEHGLSLFEYAPTQIKAAVTGYGNADKLQVTKMVSALLKSTPTGADAADACAVAICHINHSGSISGSGNRLKAGI